MQTGSHTIDQALLLFGRPKSVTGFFRALRGVESEIDDTFTIILQYGPPQQDLLVTIKTNIVSPMLDQLKYFVRGTKGAFVKVSPVQSSRERDGTAQIHSFPLPPLSSSERNFHEPNHT